jgi:hypothetical protein
MKNKHSAQKFFASMLIGTALCLLSSCPDPITRATAIQVKDAIAPVIVISSPAEGCVCANIVEIVGTVTDAATESGNDGKTASLSYEVSGSTVAGSVAFSANGAFVFQISTVTLGTSFTLSITAADWNGNSAKVLLPLRKQSGTGIPSFAVSPGNQQATLTWEPVPHTASYVLYYTTNGSLPSEQVGLKVLNATSPCVLSGLPDGNLHVFQLKAVPETGWPESISDYVKTIPLSPQTLAPRITGGIRQIRVEWNSIPAAQEFEVWRSTDQSGTYYNLSGPIQSVSYVDTDVANSQMYWYKIRPTLAGSASSFPNSAQTDPFDFYHPAIVASCTTSEAHGVALSGSYAYVADGSAGLRAIDISNPSSPVPRGTCTTTAYGVAVNGTGTKAYVVGNGTGLQAIDLASPGSPTAMGICPTTNPVGVAVTGTWAYVADCGAGLRVIDISTDLTPLSLKGTGTTTNAQGVAVSGNYAYVADYDPNLNAAAGLRVFDIGTTPGTAIYKGICSNAIGSKAVAVSGIYAYVACGTYGLRVVNISSPTTPALMGTYPGNPVAVTVSGSYLYVADGYSGLRVYDLTIPATPALRVSCATTRASGVAVSSSYAYIADDTSGLRVIALSTPVPTLACSSVMSGGHSVDVAISGAYAYVADSALRLQVISISNLTGSLPTTGTPPSGSPLGVAVSGAYAYVADLNGLQVIDISTPATPTILGNLAIQPLGIAVSGSFAYAASGSAGLQVIDISNPAQPVLKGTCSTTNAQKVAVSGSYAYVADYGSGLQVIDISDPDNPRLVASCDTPGAAYGVAISGAYAYIADYGSGLQVIDVSNLAIPLIITGTYNTPGNAVGVTVSGSYAYVADYTFGLQVIDISNPALPVFKNNYDTPGTAYAVAVSGAYAYVADYNHGLQVIDLMP